MTFDWTISIGSVLTLVGFVVSAVVAYYTMQRDTDRRFADLVSRVDTKFADLNVRLERVFEGDIRELRTRVEKLEAGQEAVLKAVVDRTHKLGDTLNLLVLKVDRLERPHAGQPGGPSGGA